MKRTLIAAILAATMPLLAEETPEKAVTAYYAAMTGTNFEAAVRQVHPTELAKIKEIIVPFIEKSAQTNGLPPQLRLFAQSNTVEQIAKFAPEEIFTRLMSWYANYQPMWVSLLKRTTMAPIGTVKEGDVIHVVCRQTATMDTNAVRTAVVVIPSTKDQSEWKIMPPDIQMLAQQLMRQGAMMRPAMRMPPSPGRTAPSSYGPLAPREMPPHKAPVGTTPAPAPTPATPTQTTK